MAKENKNQAAVKPEETPVNETQQNPVETEVKQEEVVNNETMEETPKDETIQNPVETEVKQGDVIIELPEETPEDKTPESFQIIVVKRFKDKFDHKTLYVAGQELIVAEERADDLINRGLAKLKE